MLLPAVLVAALAPNIVNLFDLRPGRAGKFFLAAMVLLMIKSYLSKGLNPTLLLGAPVLGGVAAYLPTDLKGRAMLGDTGLILRRRLWRPGCFGGDPVFTVLTLFFFSSYNLRPRRSLYSNDPRIISLLKILDNMGRD